ncbi:MAG: VanW family protein [Selenomonadaceae bacterium]|nr:VanW family protein [Selenomonadaceae bacterium]
MEVMNAENRDWKQIFAANKIPIAAASLAVVAGVTGAAVSNSIADSNKIISGVQFEGQPLAGLNETAAQNFFQSAAAQKIHPLTFRYGNTEFKINPSEIKLKPQIDKAVAEAQSYGRGKDFLGNLSEQLSTFSKGRNVALAATYDEDLLNQKIAEIAAQVDRQPVNAVCRVSDKGVEKIPGEIGKKLDQSKIAADLKAPLTSLKLPKNIELVPEDIQPFITTSDIAPVDSILGEYTTYYYPGARGDNIWLAANSISDKIVKTGWIFSFNDTVGPRSYSAGYQNAPVIVNGKTEDGVGGGVCQVSSTLYNAVLLAGLTPVERTSHFFPSSYVSAGRDATVAEDYIDFKFRNDLPHPVYLTSYANGSTLTVFVLGTKADLNGSTVAIETEGDAKNPSVYRVYYNNGQAVKSEFLHTDKYYDPKDFEDRG